MDVRHAEHLKPGTRVAVFMGALPSEVMGVPPFVTTATVASPSGGDPGFIGDGVWLAVDIAQGETLPQRYRVEEIIGFLLPMAVVERSADGQTVTGHFPPGTVAP